MNIYSAYFAFSQVATKTDDHSMVVRIEQGQPHAGEFYTVQDRLDENQVLLRRPNPGGRRWSMRPERPSAKNDSHISPKKRSKKDRQEPRRSRRISQHLAVSSENKN